jgi:hypothetical protein
MSNLKHTVTETATHVKNVVAETASKVGRAASEVVHGGEQALAGAAHKAKDLAVGAADKIRHKEVVDAGADNLSKLEAQLKTWTAKLDDLVAKANAAGQQAKVDSRKQLDELKSKLEVARSKLDEAKAAGIGKWETLRQGVERTWQELEATFKKLVQ